MEGAGNQNIGIAVEGFQNNSNAGFEKSRAQNNNNNLNIRKRKNNNNNKGALEDKCESCGKLDWNWIILVLMVIIAMMALIVFNV
jgi:hypothetical protein